MALLAGAGAPPLAAAQSAGGDDATAEAAADGADASLEAHAETDATAPKSGFGQVMAVLTGLLRDAAMREAGDADDGFALEDPALRIAVTPVQGSDSFLQAPRAPDRDARRPPRAGALEDRPGVAIRAPR